MADKKLNEVTKVTDMAYVPVIMSDGSIGQIAKSDLASVVAEQMYKGSLRTVDSFNSAINPGMYLYTGNIPSELGTSNFGIVVVYQAGNYISQVIYGAHMISFRMSYDKGAIWTPFKNISA